MKHSRSSSENLIRDIVVSRLRDLFPAARIVHELNVAGQGSNRIDVAAISPQAIVAVEIKSEKDTLKRLADQFDAFRSCCHFVLIAAHEKHFAPYREAYWRDDVPDDFYLNHELFFGKWGMQKNVWRFPPDGTDRGTFRRFDPIRDTASQPKASALLEMLWAAELRDECSRNGIAVSSRSTRQSMIRDMVWLMNGRDIATATCRQLRQRQFAEADAPIDDAGVPQQGGAA